VRLLEQAYLTIRRHLSESSPLGMAATRPSWKPWDQLLTREIAQFAHCDQSEVKQREDPRNPSQDSEKHPDCYSRQTVKAFSRSHKQDCWNRSSRWLAGRIAHKYPHEMRGFSPLGSRLPLEKASRQHLIVLLLSSGRIARAKVQVAQRLLYLVFSFQTFLLSSFSKGKGSSKMQP
jgi:hypothetical protein